MKWKSKYLKWFFVSFMYEFDLSKINKCINDEQLLNKIQKERCLYILQCMIKLVNVYN